MLFLFGNIKELTDYICHGKKFQNYWMDIGQPNEAILCDLIISGRGNIFNLKKKTTIKDNVIFLLVHGSFICQSKAGIKPKTIIKFIFRDKAPSSDCM